MNFKFGYYDGPYNTPKILGPNIYVSRMLKLVFKLLVSEGCIKVNAKQAPIAHSTLVIAEPFADAIKMTVNYREQLDLYSVTVFTSYGEFSRCGRDPVSLVQSIKNMIEAEGTKALLIEKYEAEKRVKEIEAMLKL